MHITVVTFVLNTHSGARSGIDLATALAARGHQVDLIYTPKLFDAQLARHLTSLHISLYQNSDPFKLYSLLKKLHPQVISFHGILSQLLVCRLTVIPIYSHYYGTQFVDSFLGNIAVYIKSLPLIWLPHHMYGISKYCSEESWRLYKRRITTIYLGTTIFPKFKKTVRKKTSKLNLLAVSRIVSYKGFHHLINIVKDFPVNLTIAGSSPNLSYLSYLRSLSNSNVKIIINPSDSKLATLYQHTDIYLSADKYLFFGLPILEAEFFKLPVVSLNYAAAPEVVLHNTTGFVAKNLTEFKNYLILLLKKPSLRKKFGLAGFLHCQTFSWSKTAKLLETAYAKKTLR